MGVQYQIIHVQLSLRMFPLGFACLIGEYVVHFTMPIYTFTHMQICDHPYALVYLNFSNYFKLPGVSDVYMRW